MVNEKNILVQNIPVRVLTTGNADKAMVFVHGNSADAEMWLPQLEASSLSSKYQLVAFDLPGCGKSGKSKDYNMRYLASLIPQVVSQLGIEEYILVGLSLGTILIGEAAPQLTGCKGLFLASVNLTSNKYNPGTWLNPFPEVAALMSASVPDDVLNSFAYRLVLNNTAVANTYKNSYQNTDPDFRLAIADTIAKQDWTDEIENVLNMKVPICIVFGKEDKILHTNYLDDFPARWRKKTFLIPDAGHFVNGEQPEAFNKLLIEFAQDVF